MGPELAADLAGELSADVVVNAINRFCRIDGNPFRLFAQEASLALANKESLIVGGSLVTELAAKDQILPVDSEHSAIAQCLLAGQKSEVFKTYFDCLRWSV